MRDIRDKDGLYIPEVQKLLQDAYERGIKQGYKLRDGEIVRCKDCKHCEVKTSMYKFKDEWYYSPYNWCDKNCFIIENFDAFFCADGEVEEDD